MEEDKSRSIYIDSDISAENVTDAIEFILSCNKEDSNLQPDKRQPIIVYIMSLGGEYPSGMGLVDIILNSETPVYTVNIGCAYSMAFLIGLAGHKRFSLEHASFLMHDGSVGREGTIYKVLDQSDFLKKEMESTKKFVLSHSSLTEKEYDTRKKDEWYMNAEEAKRKGFIDFIIGKDCHIKEIY